MQYLLLIYQNEKEWPTGAERDKMHADYGTFTQSIIQGGQFKGGDALQGTATATTVRVRDGKMSVTDGPFAETKEQLAGFYLIDARDLNEAIQLASKIPPARVGSVEVRPTRELGQR